MHERTILGKIHGEVRGIIMRMKIVGTMKSKTKMHSEKTNSMKTHMQKKTNLVKVRGGEDSGADREAGVVVEIGGVVYGQVPQYCLTKNSHASKSNYFMKKQKWY